MSWETRTLSEVADHSLGKMLDKVKNKGELLPYLANINVRWGEFDLTSLREMRFEQHEMERFGLRNGDIVMCEGGEPGRCALWRGERPSMMFQKAIHRIRPYEFMDSGFLYYQFLHLGMMGGFAPYFTGATIKHLPREQLARVPIRVADIDTQRRITAALAPYDDLIATNQRRIALLEEAARRLYREWFVHLRFPGHEVVKVVDGVPEGWARTVFSDVVQINPRTPFEKGVERPFVEMAALSERLMVVGERSSRVISGGAKFRNGDTLLARITPCIENGKTGFVQFLESDDAVASGSTEFIVLRSAKANPWWVYCTAREDSFREHAIRSMSGSDGRQRVNTGSFSQFEVLLPPQDVLEQFAAMVAESFTQVEQLTNQGKTLAKARDALLPKLMSGQLDVSGIPLPDLKAA
ncbi:restriction endonuclease subunit S [Pseudoxanthomonas winnipegensis]|uniref:Restriction endonuclease subunit S n=1 Tax=Pseudoxanthomonas winnipegensis TaxID=2480810 RepID=A0A4Q8LX45_9GAMM|nr:restriction endonuclease subunit S [Pseudoxanthomonas winnipegensis]TAA36982.1 restriction endonuclease subunit S [Pseudoxanthomonas winnipegensis]